MIPISHMIGVDHMIIPMIFFNDSIFLDIDFDFYLTVRLGGKSRGGRFKSNQSCRNMIFYPVNNYGD